jgi:hypothetical protein
MYQNQTYIQWQCQYCGQWVYGGYIHQCPTLPLYPQQTQAQQCQIVYRYTIDTSQLTLERIAKALEALVEQNKVKA